MRGQCEAVSAGAGAAPLGGAVCKGGNGSPGIADGIGNGSADGKVIGKGSAEGSALGKPAGNPGIGIPNGGTAAGLVEADADGVAPPASRCTAGAGCGVAGCAAGGCAAG